MAMIMKSLSLLLLPAVIIGVVVDFDNDHDRIKPEHALDIEVKDFSHSNLPKVRVRSRVIDLISGTHFDHVLQDVPDEMRPPGAVMFYDSSNVQCMTEFNELNWDHFAETLLPNRERLFVGRYDTFAAPRRAWYKFTPEMDLEKRLNVERCPQLVFIPPDCNGETEWCSRYVFVTHISLYSLLDSIDIIEQYHQHNHIYLFIL